MNSLLVNALLATGQLKAGQEYDFDFEHQFIETEKSPNSCGFEVDIGLALL